MLMYWRIGMELNEVCSIYNKYLEQIQELWRLL